MTVSYALIADIIRSRELPDRRRAQHVIYETLDRAAEDLALTQHPYATVGDELQAVSATLTDALALTLRTHLLLPEGLGVWSRTARHGGLRVRRSRGRIIARMRGDRSFEPGCASTRTRHVALGERVVSARGSSIRC